jgi:hypothetical protein
MRESIIFALSQTWNLTSLAKTLKSCAYLKPSNLLIFDEQIEVWSPEGSGVIIEEMPDIDHRTGYLNKDELLSDPGIDERFRQDLPALLLFAADFDDVNIARRVLRCVMEEAVRNGETAWIDACNGTSASQFLARTDQDPQWDWRVR